MTTKQTEKPSYNTENKKIEQQSLDGSKKGILGAYCNLFSAKSQIEGQDGGVVTALLLKGLQEGIFDVAIVVRRRSGYNAEAVAAKTTEEILASKGTVYYRVSITKKLQELLAEGKKRIAVVCTPCEIKTIRKIQQTLSKDIEITVIGLFCFGAFNLQRLKEEIKTQLGVDLDKATKTQVKQDKFIVWVEDKKFSCGIKDLDKTSEKACNFCGDFVSQLSDVSVGSAGSKTGYSTVIVRSNKGAKLTSGLDVEIDVVDKCEIAKLARLKMKRIENNDSE
jgi:coenzyme F420 hydrogenase subunit beta